MVDSSIPHEETVDKYEPEVEASPEVQFFQQFKDIVQLLHMISWMKTGEESKEILLNPSLSSAVDDSRLRISIQDDQLSVNGTVASNFEELIGLDERLFQSKISIVQEMIEHLDSESVVLVKIENMQELVRMGKVTEFMIRTLGVHLGYIDRAWVQYEEAIVLINHAQEILDENLITNLVAEIQKTELVIKSRLFIEISKGFIPLKFLEGLTQVVEQFLLSVYGSDEMLEKLGITMKEG